MEGLNVDHQLFFQQHAALVHQLQQAVAKEETLAPPARPKTERTEVKDFLDLLSSQNRFFEDISEPTSTSASASATATYEHEGRSPIYDDPHHQATTKRPPPPPPSDDNALLLRPPSPPQQ
jgi:hypothetical protein